MSDVSGSASPPTVSGRRMVGFGVVAAIVLLVAALIGFRRCGSGRFVGASVKADGVLQVGKLSRGIVGCMVGRRATELPPSAGPVPAEASMLAGAGYETTAQDWSAEAFQCAGFAQSGKQRYQYRWERKDKDHGVASGRGDLDGDGTIDAVIEMEVICQGEGSARGCGVRPKDAPDAATSAR